MDTASPPVSPSVVAAILMIQKTKVTSGTLLTVRSRVSLMRRSFSCQFCDLCSFRCPGVPDWLDGPQHPIHVTRFRSQICAFLPSFIIVILAKCFGRIRWAIGARRTSFRKGIDRNLVRWSDLLGSDACSKSNELVKSVYSGDE